MMTHRYETRWAWRHPIRWLRIVWLPFTIALLIGGLALVATRSVFDVTVLPALWPILIGGLATVIIAATFAPLHEDLQTFVAVSMFAVAGSRVAAFLWAWGTNDLSRGAGWVAVTFALHWAVLMLIGLRMPIVLEEVGRKMAVEAGRDDRGVG